MSVQLFPQAASPARHRQAEPLQVCPVAQALPQVPQFALLLVMSVQAPLHKACPAVHCEPWPPEPPVETVGLPPLLDAEHAVGSADPRHKSSSNPMDLFMLAGGHAFQETQSPRLTASRQRKASLYLRAT